MAESERHAGTYQCQTELPVALFIRWYDSVDLLCQPEDVVPLKQESHVSSDPASSMYQLIQKAGMMPYLGDFAH